MSENPFTDSVAAVSAGIHKGTPILDLNYEEDRDASVDANIVMTGTQKFVEVQSSGEEATYSQNELNALIELGKKGIETLTSIQNQAIEAGLA